MRQLAVWMMGLILALFGATSYARAPETTTESDASPSDSTSLTLAVDDACKAMESAVRDEVDFDWPCDEEGPIEGEEAVAACRGTLVDALVEKLSDVLGDEASLQTASLVTRWERQGRAWEALQVVSRLGGDLDHLVEQAVEELKTEAEERLAKIDLTAATAEADAETAWNELVESAGEELSDRCRGELVEDVFTALAIQNLSESAAAAHEADLTRQDGFSPIVRCRWLRTSGQADRLDCEPGIRLSGQDAATVQVLPPAGEEHFRLAWVQATTAEEGKRPDGAVMACPGFQGGDARKLACDELCFAATARIPDGVCDDGFRSLPVQAATIAVHMPRRFGTSYGCLSSGVECALNRLRGDGAGNLQREKLSLVLQGKTPHIIVHALDDRGRLATGAILVGYERWRVETGGFLAVSPLVDEEPVQLLASADGTVEIDGEQLTVGEGQIAVGAIREDDDWSQETGIFVNFIPRNYEVFGVGFGLAAHDGAAPSVYLAPIVLRLRSFGHRGLASFSAGVVMREVDRFPDFEPGVYDADSAFLESDPQFDADWFFGIQLGFSFGSISVPGAEDE